MGRARVPMEVMGLMLFGLSMYLRCRRVVLVLVLKLFDHVFQTNMLDMLKTGRHSLNRHYYSVAINYRKNKLAEKMLLNVYKKKWTDGPTLEPFDTQSKTNEQTVQVLLNCIFTLVICFI
ncbi:uncharacterized protein [Rutidosis leptorrhynchoides]|uniref:uncharacterized protein n=1 Tax=Rutidosis leptorrhynchoides TaxID=125765 RepID=UPI003A99D5C9